MNPSTLQSLIFSHLLGCCLLELFPSIQLLEVEGDEETFSYAFSNPTPLDETLLTALEEKLQAKIWQGPSICYSEMMRENLASLFSHRKQLFKKKQAMQAGYNIVTVIKIGEYVDLFPSFNKAPILQVKHFQFIDFLNLSSQESSYVYCVKGVQAEDKFTWKKNLKRAKEKKRSHHLKLGEKQQLLCFSSSFQEPLFLPKGCLIVHRMERALNKRLEKAAYQVLELPKTCYKDIDTLLESCKKSFTQAEAVLRRSSPTSYYAKSYQELKGLLLRYYPNIKASVQVGGVLSKDLSFEKEALSLLQLWKEHCQDLGFQRFFLKDVLEEKDLDLSKEALSEYFTHCKGHNCFLWGVEDRFERQHSLLYLKRGQETLMWACTFPPFALLALMLEEHKGVFPLWLSPEVFRFLPHSKAFQDSALHLQQTFATYGIPCGIDRGSQDLCSRYKQAVLDKVVLPIEVGQQEKKGIFKLKNFPFCPLEQLSLKQLLALGKKILDTKVFLSENLLLNIDEAQ